MKTRNLAALALTMGLLQVGCSSDDKTAAVAACSDNTTTCAQKYIQIAGGAAASGTRG